MFAPQFDYKERAYRIIECSHEEHTERTEIESEEAAAIEKSVSDIERSDYFTIVALECIQALNKLNIYSFGSDANFHHSEEDKITLNSDNFMNLLRKANEKVELYLYPFLRSNEIIFNAPKLNIPEKQAEKLSIINSLKAASRIICNDLFQRLVDRCPDKTYNNKQITIKKAHTYTLDQLIAKLEQ